MFISQDNRELIHQLLDDVKLLKSELNSGLLNPTKTRAIFTPVLRRWIIEKKFYNVQQLLLPNIIRFEIHEAPILIQQCSQGFYENWMALLVFNEIGVATSLPKTQFIGLDGKPTFEVSNDYDAAPTTQKASKFFEQPIFFYQNKFYNRKDVIEFHANALGGVHFDFKRAEKEPHIIAIKNFLGFEVKNKNFQMLTGIEIASARHDTSRRDKIYDATELVTIDTARIFVEGILIHEQNLIELLN